MANDTHSTTGQASSELKILVCYHKPYAMPPLDDGTLLPIHVGKAISNIDLHMQGDNEVNGQPCDNISEKNPNWCELTAIYWAWKNLKKLYPDIKYIGMSHYRRFFSFGNQRVANRNIDELKNYRVDTEKVVKILESGKIIAPKKYRVTITVGIAYCMVHMSSDYHACREIIRDDFPDYFPSFQKVFECGNDFYTANMFVMKYEDFTQYCEWLFSVLFKLEMKINPQNYDSYRRRVYGFLSERLFKVWLIRNKKKVQSLRVCLYANSETNHDSGRKSIFTKVASFLIRGTSYVMDKVILKLFVFRSGFMENLRRRF